MAYGLATYSGVKAGYDQGWYGYHRRSNRMDPDACLKEMREITDKLFGDAEQLEDYTLEDREADLLRLSELAEGLSDWLGMGGFAPKAWRGK